MIAMTWIQKQNIAIIITAKRAAHHFINVLVAIIIEIRKGNPMPLLNMPKPARRCHILKKFPLCISEHPVRNQRGKIRITRSQIKVQPPIIVQIPKICSHRVQHLEQT